MLNQKGTALIEILPVLVIFVLMINFALGFFGLIHSGILNSIASRNYAFETFRNRANLNYLRDVPNSDVVSYGSTGMRFHGTSKENAISGRWVVTSRPIKFTDVNEGVDEVKGNAEHDSLKKIKEGAKASDSGIDEGTSPSWVRVLYGICLNTTCGDS